MGKRGTAGKEGPTSVVKACGLVKKKDLITDKSGRVGSHESNF